MDGSVTERKGWSPAENNRGLECRHCGCRHFRVIYTRRGWGFPTAPQPPLEESPIR